MSAYPELPWDQMKFRKRWAFSNRRAFMDQLALKLSKLKKNFTQVPDIRRPDDWYHVPSAVVMRAGGAGLLEAYNFSLINGTIVHYLTVSKF